LHYYQQNTGVMLDEFEVTTLVAMSRTYLGMLHDARTPACPWPCKRPLTDAEKIAQSKRMKRRIRKESE
jgi:hypothetical protein